MIVILLFVLLFIVILTGHPLATTLGGLALYFGYFVWGGNKVFQLLPNKIFGTVNNYVLVAVPLFIFMANLLNESGVVDNLFDSLLIITKKFRAGIPIIVIAICTLFAACTGVVGASIVTMGLVAIPKMLEYGYSKTLTTGLIAAGGSLGILIPPSIMLVVMAEQATLSVGKLFAACVLPGISLSVLYMLYVVIITYFIPNLAFDKKVIVHNIETENIDLKMVFKAITSVLPTIILIFGVLGTIFLGIATPTEAAGVGAFLAFLIIVIAKKFSIDLLKNIVKSTAITTSQVMIVLAVAGFFASVFVAIGGDVFVSKMILSLESKWMVLFVMMSILFFLGMFIDWVGIVYITFPIFLPIAKQLGFDTLWFVASSAVLLQTSFLTPPFGYALFFLKGIVPKNVVMFDIYKGIIPFVILMVLGFITITVFPGLVLWLPGVLFK